MRDYGWPDQVFTTHYHGDDSELPMLVAGATTGRAGSGRWVNREVLRLAVATLLVRRDQTEAGNEINATRSPGPLNDGVSTHDC
jgi:hypothetical protein